MSLLLRACALVLVAVALGACSAGESGSLGSPSVLAPGADGRPGTGEAPGSSDTTACDEVVAGIDAFNLGDFEETVARFEQAVPLAEAEDAAAGTRASAELLEAVRYYAALAPDDYLPASVASPDFARYKTITLGQCASAPAPDGEGGGVFA
ncbi:hypothetical protein BH09ACT12_BH09ACT12_00370 [soil metagenome]